jgi:hypothetical protein
MPSKVQQKIRQVSLCLKEHGYTVGKLISLTNLNMIIEETVGLDKRTKDVYARALCNRGYIKDTGNWTFEVLKTAEDENPPVVSPEAV